MEVISTKRGGAMLLHDGYSYTRIKVNESTLYWTCRQRGACKAKITTDLSSSRILTFSSEHTHAGDPTELNALRVRHEMKTKARKYSKRDFLYLIFL